jgi:meso-butanediol dehydrogenase / (S,S)-butanediol dehydrogenase / diacetyl reductase
LTPETATNTGRSRTTKPDRPVAVVTGAGDGVGRATGHRLASHGWSVVAVDINVDGLAWAQGSEAVIPCHADVATKEGNARMAAAVVDGFGGLDAAVLNAAVIAGGSIESLPIEALDHMYAVNLRGVVLGIRSVIHALRVRGGGAISVTLSVSGVTGEEANWAYGSTKAGILNAVQGVALEVGRDNIRVNALCPPYSRNRYESTR